MNYSFERPEELLIVMFFLSSSFENQICCKEEERPEWQGFLLERHDVYIHRVMTCSEEHAVC